MLENIVFTDSFDEIIATHGPMGLFTLTHEGEVQFDLYRTRDWKRRFLSDQGDVFIDWCHCVMVDRATGWPMYCLITSPVLVGSDDRTKTIQFDDFRAAQVGLARLKEEYFQDSQSNLSSETA